MTYNHAFTIAFSVSGSTDPEGDDVSPAQMRAAITDDSELLEAVGAPFDTYEEE